MTCLAVMVLLELRTAQQGVDGCMRPCRCDTCCAQEIAGGGSDGAPDSCIACWRRNSCILASSASSLSSSSSYPLPLLLVPAPLLPTLLSLAVSLPACARALLLPNQTPYL